MDASFILIAVAVLLAVLLLVVVVVLARLGGRLAQLSTGQTAAQAQLTRTLEERLDAVTKRLGDSLSEQTEKTGRNLTDLQKRLAVIDSAQKNITELSSQVVGLQDILSNKQARGAFGRIQLRDLVAEALPPDRVSSEFAEDVLAKLSEMGVNVVESDDSEGEEESSENDQCDWAHHGVPSV